MAVLGDRRKPSEGLGLELYARALALEHSSGKRAVLASTDMLGFPATVGKVVSERVREQYEISRDRLLLKLLTHCGPVVGHMLQSADDLTPHQLKLPSRSQTSWVVAKRLSSRERADVSTPDAKARTLGYNLFIGAVYVFDPSDHASAVRPFQRASPECGGT